jgi:hypothetical protein
MDKQRRGAAAALRWERRALLRELAGLEGLIRGTYLTRYATCARPGCACHRGHRHGPIVCVAVSAGGRQRQHYVRQGQAAAAREGVRQYHRLLAVADRITAINLQLLREGRLDERGER